MPSVAETWFTTVAAIRAGEPDWQAIAAYRRPILGLLGRIAPGLPSDEREDVAQEVLTVLRTKAIARYAPERGRFRDYLRGIVRNLVRRALRERHRTASFDPDTLGEVPETEWSALDAEAWLLRGLARLQDDLVAGGKAEREVLYCFSDRVLKGMSYEEIARRERLSQGAVSRRLAKARQRLLRCLLEVELEQSESDLSERQRDRLVDAVQRALSERRPLDELLHRSVRQALPLAEQLLGDVQACFAQLTPLEAPEGQAFLRALAEVLDAGGSR